MNNEKIYWVWFAEAVGAGSSLGVKLVNRFGSARRVYEADPSEIRDDLPGFNKSEIDRARRILSSGSTDGAERIIEAAENCGQRIVVPSDDDFPLSLKNLRDAPLALYVLGALPRFDRGLFVSVVGTRKMSDYGKVTAFSLG
ncbi:MAG: DNA-processing protein DprA [Clostridia bacterium]|nr:DNA-processing protein DprA [Clostridia bacterium]